MKANDTVVIDMTQYGINTMVGATAKKIDFYLNAYKTKADKKFGGGVGKKNLMSFTYKSIIKEDMFFSDNLNAAIEQPQRWEDFLEDCVVYATLHSHFNNAALPLIVEPFTRKHLIDAIDELINRKHH